MSLRSEKLQQNGSELSTVNRVVNLIVVRGKDDGSPVGPVDFLYDSKSKRWGRRDKELETLSPPDLPSPPRKSSVPTPEATANRRECFKVQHNLRVSDVGQLESTSTSHTSTVSNSHAMLPSLSYLPFGSYPDRTLSGSNCDAPACTVNSARYSSSSSNSTASFASGFSSAGSSGSNSSSGAVIPEAAVDDIADAKQTLGLRAADVDLCGKVNAAILLKSQVGYELEAVSPKSHWGSLDDCWVQTQQRETSVDSCNSSPESNSLLNMCKAESASSQFNFGTSAFDALQPLAPASSGFRLSEAHIKRTSQAAAINSGERIGAVTMLASAIETAPRRSDSFDSMSRTSSLSLSFSDLSHLGLPPDADLLKDQCAGLLQTNPDGAAVIDSGKGTTSRSGSISIIQLDLNASADFTFALNPAFSSKGRVAMATEKSYLNGADAADDIEAAGVQLVSPWQQPSALELAGQQGSQQHQLLAAVPASCDGAQPLLCSRCGAADWSGQAQPILPAGSASPAVDLSEPTTQVPPCAQGKEVPLFSAAAVDAAVKALKELRGRLLSSGRVLEPRATAKADAHAACTGTDATSYRAGDASVPCSTSVDPGMPLAPPCPQQSLLSANASENIADAVVNAAQALACLGLLNRADVTDGACSEAAASPVASPGCLLSTAWNNAALVSGTTVKGREAPAEPAPAQLGTAPGVVSAPLPRAPCREPQLRSSLGLLRRLRGEWLELREQLSGVCADSSTLGRLVAAVVGRQGALEQRCMAVQGENAELAAQLAREHAQRAALQELLEQERAERKELCQQRNGFYRQQMQQDGCTCWSAPAAHFEIAGVDEHRQGLHLVAAACDCGCGKGVHGQQLNADDVGAARVQSARCQADDECLAAHGSMQGEGSGAPPADVDELLLCLGQESSKVAALVDALRAAGGDPEAVIAKVEYGYLADMHGEGV